MLINKYFAWNLYAISNSTPLTARHGRWHLSFAYHMKHKFQFSLKESFNEAILFVEIDVTFKMTFFSVNENCFI